MLRRRWREAAALPVRDMRESDPIIPWRYLPFCCFAGSVATLEAEEQEAEVKARVAGPESQTYTFDAQIPSLSHFWMVREKMRRAVVTPTPSQIVTISSQVLVPQTTCTIDEQASVSPHVGRSSRVGRRTRARMVQCGASETTSLEEDTVPARGIETSRGRTDLPFPRSSTSHKTAERAATTPSLLSTLSSRSDLLVRQTSCTIHWKWESLLHAFLRRDGGEMQGARTVRAYGEGSLPTRSRLFGTCLRGSELSRHVVMIVPLARPVLRPPAATPLTP